MNAQTTDGDKLTDDYIEAAERQPRKNGHSHMGTPPPEISELVRAEDRLSFAYFEHCTIGRDDNAITATDSTGVTHIPAATLSVLMLGPGTRVTHQAMTVIGENGATVIWVGGAWRSYVCLRQTIDAFFCTAAKTGGSRV